MPVLRGAPWRVGGCVPSWSRCVGELLGGEAGQISKSREMDELRGEPNDKSAVVSCGEFLTGAGYEWGRVKCSSTVARNCSYPITA